MEIVGAVSKKIENISKEKIYNLLTDVDNWSKWNENILDSKLLGEFKEGTFIKLAIKDAPKSKIKLLKIKRSKSFTYLTTFLLAKMYTTYEILEKNNHLELSASIKIEGPLSFFWKQLVVQDVADVLEADVDSFVRLIK
ncbi:MAG: hypothetical protein HRT43_03715 [Campylobacteraceae bacterium]|nr:hypothetical protein [Campylobacteraceae bacterium]